MAPDDTDERRRLGRCADCRFGRRVRTARGAEFLMCRRSEGDPRYARYPRLPVIRCEGHDPRR
jgi:hypothetical protein